MRVRYTHGNPGVWYGNIYWSPPKPARYGVFPADHPCAPKSQLSFGNDGQFGESDVLKKFRELGYWASCFPEGDGITMKDPSQRAADVVMQDIKSVFGWDVKLNRQ